MSTTEITQQGSVACTVDQGIATIQFGHPASNSLPGKLLRELAENITATGQREDVTVIVLKSAGDRAFCAGASFDELLAIEDAAQGKQFFSGFAGVINAMRTCPKIIIGRVQGKAVGGGVGVAASVDICYATKFAATKLSELAIGIGPFVVGPAIERKIGLSAMSQMSLEAKEWKSAEWSRDKGLYAKVFETAEELDEGVAALAAELAASNPESLKRLKKAFWVGTDHWDELLLQRAADSGELVLSSFTRDTLEGFRQK